MRRAPKALVQSTDQPVAAHVTPGWGLAQVELTRLVFRAGFHTLQHAPELGADRTYGLLARRTLQVTSAIAATIDAPKGPVVAPELDAVAARRTGLALLLMHTLASERHGRLRIERLASGKQRRRPVAAALVLEGTARTQRGHADVDARVVRERGPGLPQLPLHPRAAPRDVEMVREASGLRVQWTSRQARAVRFGQLAPTPDRFDVYTSVVAHGDVRHLRITTNVVDGEGLCTSATRHDEGADEPRLHANDGDRRCAFRHCESSTSAGQDPLSTRAHSHRSTHTPSEHAPLSHREKPPHDSPSARSGTQMSKSQESPSRHPMAG